MSAKAPDQPIRFQALSPERRRARPMVTHCGCCCCCCCCLHTFGGLLGAAVGSTPGRNDYQRPLRLPDEDVLRPFGVEARLGGQFTDQEPEPPPEIQIVDVPRFSVGGSGTALYWLILVALSLFIGCTGFPRWSGMDGMGIWVLAIYGPGVQIAASVLALMSVLFLRREEQGAAARRIGKITLGSVIGTIVGIGIMMVLCGIPFGWFR